MWDSVQFAFNPIVAPFSVLLLVAVIYWLFVILGVLGLELLDVDWDADAGFDGEPGGDAFSVQALKFFHVGEVPIMIIFTFFATSMWATTYLTTAYLQGEDVAPWIPILLIGPNLVLTLILMRVGLLPFRSFFGSLNDAHRARTEIVGQVCLITSLEVDEKFGQAEIAQDGPPIVVSVHCRKGDRFRKGDAALIDSYCTESNTYLVVPKRTEV